MLIPVILCGGVGSRLWPISREDNPKQFLKLHSNKSLFQETVLRVNDKEIFTSPIIICGEKHKFKIASELEAINIKPYAILLEPCQRNTAPAIAVAALFIQQQFKDSKDMLVLPADHSIKNNKEFIDCIKQVKSFSDKGIITFGITPTHPATGYGYIKAGHKFYDDIYSVESFTEKPNKSTAEKFIASKNYFWNSGMFLINNSIYLEELEKINPNIFAIAKQVINLSDKIFGFIELAPDHFHKFENISVDVAILEKTKNLLICPIKIDWLDLGNWHSVYMDLEKSADGNVTIGDKIYSKQCKDTLIYSTCNTNLIANKLENICIIATEDAVLITNKDNTEDVKEIYSNFKKTNSSLTQTSNKSYRPWGYYEIILDAPTYKIKRISIAPYQQISLQYHLKRSEHWVITKGIATITKGDKIFQLKTNESAYIPVREIHKIANNSANPLELIEIQIGEILSEEDIVRIEDKYGRIEKK